MQQRNDGTGEANILQNQFTAYLLTAIKRRKAAYWKEKLTRQQSEVYTDLFEFDIRRGVEVDPCGELPILQQIEHPLLLQALLQAKERERYIFLTRILDERSFMELAEELGISYKAATNSYYRFLEKIKEALKGDENDD